MAEMLIVWSARFFVLCYALRLACDFLVTDVSRRERWGRWAWTIGVALLVLHLALAFHFVHHWSHASLVAQTARRTYEVTGMNWGGGVYVNYAFALLWVLDVGWWWTRAGSTRGEPAFLYWIVQAVFAFIMFNATVVFGPPFWKWVVALAAALLIGARFLIRRAPGLRHSNEVPPSEQPAL